ncbi:MAG: hypothetical protein ACR2HA_11300 [Nocardioides sp.]
MKSVGVEVAEAVDAALSGPVLVIGSPPPGGRDLDLLAQPDDYKAISSWLGEAGFVRWRHTWARFDEPGVYGVELCSTARWRTSRGDASSLFADAEPIAGFRHLRSPSPATVLLLAARGSVTRRGRITEKVRRRVDEALERDPGAWRVAEERARDLGLMSAVRLLRESYQTSGQLSPSARAAGLAGVLLCEGPLGAKAKVLLGARPRRVRPAIVSFSGLDGSGKSTQVGQLQARLDQLGVTSEVQWAGFKLGKRWHATVPLLDRPIRTGRQHDRQPHDPVFPAALAGSSLGRHAWVFVVVGLNTAHLWRLVLRRRPGSDVLIFDRFSPDSMVKLDLHFTRFRAIDIGWQRKLFTLVSPKPEVGFLVDVSSGVAYGRRQEQTPEELAHMCELYHEHLARFRLHRFDGTRAPGPLSEDIAVAAWRGLR